MIQAVSFNQYVSKQFCNNVTRGGSLKTRLGILPMHLSICLWFAGGKPSKDQKQGEGEVIFYCHIYLATCRLEVLVPNNIDIDYGWALYSVFEHCSRVLCWQRTLLVRHIPYACVTSQSPTCSQEDVKALAPTGTVFELFAGNIVLANNFR